MKSRLSGLAATMLLLGGTGIGVAQEPDAQYHEAITVTRYLVDARVSDAAGNAVKGLGPEDFLVRIEGRVAEVEAATWMGDAAAAEEPVDGVPSAKPASRPPVASGRLVVFFVNTDFGRNAPRIKGQMAFDEIFVNRIFALLRPEDLVAVFSFDSHLKLRTDFTSDRPAAREAVSRSLWIEKVPLPEPRESGPSLVRHLDSQELLDAADGQEALLLIARALTNIEGKKLMIMPSWGLGDLDYSSGSMTFSREFSEAVSILRAEHVPVVSVHTGVLDGQLTAGVALTARATGGVFTSAVAPLPAQSLTRIEGFFEGYYELVLRLDDPLEEGEHEIEIRTSDKSLLVYSPPAVMVRKSDRLYSDAVAFINRGEDEAGTAMLRDSLLSEHVPVDVLIDRLQAMIDAGQWQASLVLIEELERLEAVDNDVASMRNTVNAAFRKEEKTDAHACLDRARRILLDGGSDGVRQLLDQAIAIDPMLGEAWYERGMLRLGEGDTEGAAADLRRYLEVDPQGRFAIDAGALLETLDR